MALLTGGRISDDKNIVNVRGFILSEILLAGAILSIAIASTVVIIGSLQSMVSSTQNGFAAALIARRQLALAHLASFNDLTATITTEIKSGIIFTTNFSVSYRNSFTANISADVSWQEGVFEKHRIFADQIVDWKNATDELDCSWLDNAKGQLAATTSQILNIDVGNPVTDIAVRGDYAFISADATTTGLPDLYVVDIHDIHNPVIVSHLNTGPGIASIATASHYVFAANAGTYQMQIIDIADPTHPVLISQAKLPGVVISGGTGFGQSVAYYDHKLFIGLVKANGPEFHIIDVSNPTSPIALGSYEVGSTVNDIAVQGSSAVIATPGQKSVSKLDISNPLNIQEIGQSTLTGWTTQGARSVALLGRYVYIGRNLGGFYGPNPEFVLLDRDDLNTPANILSSLSIDATVDDIFVFGDYEYLATSDPAKAFEIIKNNIAVSSTTSSSLLTDSKVLPSRSVALSCNSQAMYVVTQNDQDFFHVFSLP